MRLPAMKARGFTLLEVMLAILLLAMLLAGTFGVVRTATKATQSGEAAVDRINRMRVAQEFLRQQLSRIMPLGFDRDDSTGINFVFEGDEKSMKFVAPMPGYLSKGGPYVQTLELDRDGRGLALSFTNMMLNGYDPQSLGGGIRSRSRGKNDRSEPIVLLNQIRRGHFEYRGFDEQGKLDRWTDRWKDKSLTPVMVRVVLEMEDVARIDFPPMEVAMVLDAGSMRRPFAGRNGVEGVDGQLDAQQLDRKNRMENDR
ncbi:MAG: prepilin-type N-terminal cleavage/methylation domain-containing protein [Dokdonella sp.]